MKIKSFWNHLSLKRKVLTTFLPLTMIPLLIILIISITLITQNGKKDAIKNAKNKLSLVATQSEQLIENITYNIKAFSTSTSLQTAASTNYPDNAYGNYMFTTSMHSAIYNIMDIQNLISNGYVQTNFGKTFDIKLDAMQFPNTEMKQHYTSVLAAKGKILFQSPSDKSGESIFNVSKALINIDTGENIGILSFDIRESIFFDSYCKTIRNGTESLYLIDKGGTIISSNERDRLQTPLDAKLWSRISSLPTNDTIFELNNSNSFSICTSLKNGSYYLLYTMNYYEIYQEAFHMAMLLFIIGILVLLITIILSRFLAQSFVRPITKLAAYADEAGKGNFLAPLEINSKDEIRFLADRLQNMNHNIKQLTTCIYNEQVEKREYELKMLQAQINPHFLYNCLDNISSLITDDRIKTADSMIYHLGRYYRTILSKGRNIITIKEECQLISDYLEIQLIKSPELFTYTINIPSELNDLKILKMILQPIVENSVIHGFTGYKSNLHLFVSAHIQNQTVYIQIADNGRGIPSETLTSIFHQPQPSMPKHFGLYNIQERIQLKYGKIYGIQIDSKENQGTRITVSFPKVL